MYLQDGKRGSRRRSTQLTVCDEKLLAWERIMVIVTYFGRILLSLLVALDRKDLPLQAAE